MDHNSQTTHTLPWYDKKIKSREIIINLTYKNIRILVNTRDKTF